MIETFRQYGKSNMLKVILEKYIEEAEVEPSKEMVDYYHKRTQEHIDRVRKNITFVISKLDLTKKEKDELKSRATFHDQSKWGSEELTPYIWMSWYYKLKKEGKEFKYPDGMKEKVDDAVKHHYSVNRHHPQFYNDNTSKMSHIDIIEMVCDHAAMAQEFGDDLIKWEENNTFKKFKWSKIDKDFILKIASIFI